jgi:hypothetical protein
MSKQPLDYQTPIARPRHTRRSTALLLFGLAFIGWGGVGAAFVEGAIQSGVPSDNILGVCFLLAMACAGATMAVFGLLGLVRH